MNASLNKIFRAPGLLSRARVPKYSAVRTMASDATAEVQPDSDFSGQSKQLAEIFDTIENTPTHKKSAKELERLQYLGRQMGVDTNYIKQLYDFTAPGKKRNKLEETPSKEALKGIMARTDPFALESLDTAFRKFQFDDLPSITHLQIHKHRNLREKVRAMAWEFPQLVNFRSEYQPPSKKEFLKFQYITSLEERLPIERKVVVRFTPEDTGLTGPSLHKLKLIAGGRYDSVDNVIKLSADNFPEQAQNKAHLSKVYNRLIEAAKDTSDTFEDVPLNEVRAIKLHQRRDRKRRKLEFPEEWNRPDVGRPANTLAELTNKTLAQHKRL